MADAPSLQSIYNSRYIEHSLSSAAHYLTQAGISAARAHDDLHWLEEARRSIAGAKELIEEFERFASAIQSQNVTDAAALLAENEAHVREVCARISTSANGAA